MAPSSRTIGSWRAAASAIALVGIVGALSAQLRPIELPRQVGSRLSQMLGGPLTSRFPRMSLEHAAGVDGILVLGGGEERLREAGRLARVHPHLKIHVSGAGDAAYVQGLLGPGIEPGRLTVETLARNTYENAIYSRAVIGRMPRERWLLVTSAVHMPRSMAAFRKVGLDLEAWPVHDEFGREFDPVMREWVGLVWYWISGRGYSAFPSSQRSAG